LNIFKGAKEEGFRTVCVCKEKDAIMYRKYPLVDETIIVEDFTDLLNGELQERLPVNVVLSHVLHGPICH
jgi:5-formaminoimidazole-4-carboxamide-1-(beta)-D-ribofuranosyl 5'-monophosphate synthetase